LNTSTQSLTNAAKNVATQLGSLVNQSKSITTKTITKSTKSTSSKILKK
jgi:hypothetical protein